MARGIKELKIWKIMIEFLGFEFVIMIIIIVIVIVMDFNDHLIIGKEKSFHF
jgi:hypothetical protein